MGAMRHYSPLRYPGGKAKLFRFVKDLIIHNGLDGGSYCEPYAGGAGIALGLLIEDYVSRIYINDIDKGIYSFWHSLLRKPDEFIRMVWDTPVTIEEWRRQKHVYQHMKEFDRFEVGFATFFLNRTNRSGVLKAGVIGGNDQTGNYKIDARYNKRELVDRLNTVANHGKHIKVYGQDALKFITKTLPQKDKNGLVFLDPPYFVKGKRLYTNFYNPGDHIKVAEAIKGSPLKYWLVTYDNVDAINEIYSLKDRIVYDLRYSASHTSRSGSEVMFHSNSIRLPYGHVHQSKTSTSTQTALWE